MKIWFIMLVIIHGTALVVILFFLRIALIKLRLILIFIYQELVSDLNRQFPSRFKTIYFRLLLDSIKFEIIANKLSQMEKNNFTD